MELERFTECKVSGVPDEWDVDEFDQTQKIRDAVAAVRDDHNKERVIVDGFYVLKLHWNDEIDGIQVSLFTYNGGFEVNDSSSNSEDDSSE